MDKFLNVLLLDNGHTGAENLVAELQKHDLSICIKSTNSVESFISELDRFTPKLIISDFSVPDFNCESLRDIVKSRDPKIYFIFIERGLDENIAVEIESAGKKEFKIVEKSENLICAIKSAVEHARSRINGIYVKDAFRDLINMLDDAHEGIVKLDSCGRIENVNSTFAHILSEDKAYFKGKPVTEFINTEDLVLWHAALEAIETEGKINTELRLKNGNDTSHFCRILLKKSKIVEGNGSGFYLFAEDITEAKKAEESVNEYQMFASSVLDSISSQIAIIDSVGNILAVNKAWTAFSFVHGDNPRKYYIGSNYLQVCEETHGKEATSALKFADGIRSVLKGEKKEFAMEYSIYSPSLKKWYLGKVTKFHGVGPDKAVIVFTDITRTKMVELGLIGSEEKFKYMVQNSNDIVTISDGEGMVLYASPALERVLGYKPEERYGKSVFDIIHPDDIPKIKNAFSNNIKAPNNVVTVEYWIRKANGDYIYMESIANNLLLDPNVQGIVINSRDITDRKYAEEKTSSALYEKEILLKEIHHRVKNNLQIVTSLLKLQENHIHDTDFKKIFSESIGRVKAMSLIHQGLYLENSFSHIDFGRYMRSLIEFLKEAYDTDERNIKCEIVTDKIGFNLETAVPCGLLVNELVSNALRHAFPEGRGGTLLVKLETKGKHILTIKDDGIGIPENVIFYNAKSLGLSLVNTLSQQLGAEIEIDDTNGTSYKLSFDDLVYKERVL